MLIASIISDFVTQDTDVVIELRSALLIEMFKIASSVPAVSL